MNGDTSKISTKNQAIFSGFTDAVWCSGGHLLV
jgi:hypothetical protein